MADSKYYSKTRGFRFKLGDKGNIVLNVILMCSFIIIAMKLMSSDKTAPVAKIDRHDISFYRQY